MALSKASCTGRGLIPAIGGHVHRMFDEGEDNLFSLSLDDVMDDRPWTADELMGGGARSAGPKPTSTAAPAPATTPAPASVPADDFATRPIMQAPRQTAPAPRPTSDPSETAAFLAAATQRHAPSSTPAHATPQQPTYAAPEPQPEPELEPPVMDLDDLANRQFAFDSWPRPTWTRPRPACRRSIFRSIRCLQLPRITTPITTKQQRTMTALMPRPAPPALRPRTTDPHRAHTITARLPTRLLPSTARPA